MAALFCLSSPPFQMKDTNSQFRTGKPTPIIEYNITTQVINKIGSVVYTVWCIGLHVFFIYI